MSQLTDELTASMTTLLASGQEIPASKVRQWGGQVIAAIGTLEARARGNTIHYTSGVPGDSLGQEGDLGVNKLTGDYYQFTGGQFVFLFNGLGRAGVFTPIPANQFGTHPAFANQDQVNAWLLAHAGNGGGTGPASPTITSFTPASGSVGSAVTITGTDFANASTVKFGQVTAAFTVLSATSLNTTVPAGAATAPLSVTTPGGTAVSSAAFTVTPPASAPTISSVYPASAGRGSTVVVTGTNLSGLMGAIGGQPASTYPVSITEVWVTIGQTAAQGAGTLTLTNSAGSASQAFTVAEPSDKQLIGVGNSQFDAGFTYVMRDDAEFNHPGYDVAQFTYPGKTAAFILSKRNDPYQGSDTAAHDKTPATFYNSSKAAIMAIYAVTNDLMLEGVTAQVAFDRLKALVAAGRHDGYSRIIVYTDCTFRNKADDDATQQAKYTQLQALSTMLRQKTADGDLTCGANALVDLQATPELGPFAAPLNTYWYGPASNFNVQPPVIDNDQVHWRYAFRIVYDTTNQAIAQLLAGAHGVIVATHSQVEPGPTWQNYVAKESVNFAYTNGNTLQSTQPNNYTWQSASYSQQLLPEGLASIRTTVDTASYGQEGFFGWRKETDPATLSSPVPFPLYGARISYPQGKWIPSNNDGGSVGYDFVNGDVLEIIRSAVDQASGNITVDWRQNGVSVHTEIVNVLNGKLYGHLMTAYPDFGFKDVQLFSTGTSTTR